MDEDYIRKLAYQRWELRNALQWRLWETADDDYYYAQHIARAEEMAKQCGVHSTIVNKIEK